MRTDIGCDFAWAAWRGTWRHENEKQHLYKDEHNQKPHKQDENKDERWT